MTDSPYFLNKKTLFAYSLAETFALYHIEADAAAEVKPMLETLFGRRPVFSDVKEILQCLKEKELDIAIGSTSDTDSLLFYLEQNQLVLPDVFTSEDVRAYKPNPAFYETILNRSGWRREECLFVGDDYIDDVCGPKKIGMKAALLDRKRQHAGMQLIPPPDFIIHSLYDLPGALSDGV